MQSVDASSTGGSPVAQARSVEALIEAVLTRLPRVPASVRWGSWHADARDHAAPEERRRRHWAALWSGALHAVFLFMWIWGAWNRAPAPPPATAESASDGGLQVEYITLEPPPPAEESDPATPPDDAASPPAMPLPRPPRASPSATAATEASAPQPLLVTQTDVVDSDFVLPPTRLETGPVRPAAVTTPELAVPQREIALEQTQALPYVRLPQPQPTLPPAVQPVPEPAVQVPISQRSIPLETVATRPAIPMPQATPRMRPVPAATPQANVRVPRRDVPMQSAPRTDTAASATTGAPSPAPAASASPATAAVASDDWSAPSGQRPGAAPGAGTGLRGLDGRPQLPPGMASAGGGNPPGSDAWTREGIDGNGTWLKRPPLDYRASPFEDYWRPHETLLQEWVRRGIKQMSIPIPGTSKRISCVVSMLQLGGGCGILDANVNDQEAIARPPPDIPYKPELDQAQPSVVPPSAPADD